MSTLQQTKPRLANQSITDESGLPGTARSNVGCDAIDEPCTKSNTGLSAGDPTNFSHMKSRMPFFEASCSTPCTASPATATASTDEFTDLLLVDFRAGVADDLRPQILLVAKERAELGRRRSDDLDARRRHVCPDVFLAEHGEHLAVQPLDDCRRRALRREQSHPNVRLEVGHARFHDGRHVGKLRRP